MSHPALEVRDLRFSWPGGRAWSLDVPRLDLAPGEQMLLTGPSGCGKSTLLHLVCGLLEPDGGTVRVAGTDVHALRGGARDRFRGRTIGVIFQSFHLLAGFSAIENVMAGLLFSGVPPREHRRRATALLTELGLDDPDRDPDELSVGQQQRVAVARALAAEPRLVVADEPTASLDPATGAAAVELVRRTCLAHGAALLCVSHDPALEPLFERRITLAELAAAEAPA